MENTDKNMPFQIDLNSEVAQGTYANLSIIAHSSSEFVLDFVRVLPGMPKAEVKSRVIMAPEQTKRLLLALQENIRKYENHFGPIQLCDDMPLSPLSPRKGQA